MNENQYIVTYTGEKIYPTRPDPKNIHIADIAHALANKCRFNGHTRVFYSVAQHSVAVDTFFPYENLWGLLHDAGEAYLPDVASTLKPCFPTLVIAEAACMDAIKKRFRLPELSENQKRLLKSIDRAMLKAEWESLMNNPKNYSMGVSTDGASTLHWKPSGFWNPIEAERVFLRAFDERMKKTSCT